LRSLTNFARKNFPVYVVDHVGRGRSGFDPTPINRARRESNPALLPSVPRIHFDTICPSKSCRRLLNMVSNQLTRIENSMVCRGGYRCREFQNAVRSSATAPIMPDPGHLQPAGQCEYDSPMLGEQ
jgi:hypothetical protein